MVVIKQFSIVILAAGMALASPALAQQGNADNGKKLFRQGCRVCHSVDPGTSTGGGPNLSGLTKGVAAGADSTFDYSPAFQAAAKKGLRWDKASLDGFLKAPDKVVPGTRMPVATPAAADRADLIAYLLASKP